MADETRGGWYVRQLLGSANIDGSPLFHLMSGNLSFQVEHHLYPDLPSNRYHQIAPRVREVCERYGLPYNTGPLGKQLGSVHKTILRLAFPGKGRRNKRSAGAPAASSSAEAQASQPRAQVGADLALDPLQGVVDGLGVATEALADLLVGAAVQVEGEDTTLQL